MQKKKSCLLYLMILCMSFELLVACAFVEQDNPPKEDSILIPPDGKYDTGYYSNLAMELEGDFVSTLAINITDVNESDRDRLMDQSVLRVIAEQQVKMAKGQLNEKHLHLNLTAGEVSFLEKDYIEREDGIL